MSSTDKMFCCYICKEKFTDRGLCKQHMASHKKKETNTNVHSKLGIAPIDKIHSKKAKMVLGHEAIACNIKEEPIENMEVYCDPNFITSDNSYLSNMAHEFNQNAMEEVEHAVVKFKEKVKAEPLENLEDRNYLNLLLNEYRQCENTFTGFTSEDNTDQQHAIHTGVKPYSHISIKQELNETEEGQTYKCNICAKAFSLKEDLDSHIISHTEEKMYKCSQCNKSFQTRQHHTKHFKNTHLRKHTEEKSYKCSYCDIAFAQSRYLKLHIRTHIMERLHKCRFCYKAFNRKANLTIHMRIHSGGTVLCCHCYQPLPMRYYNINGSIYKPSDELSIGVLPTKRNVIECMMYLLLTRNPWCKNSVEEASDVLARRLIRHWGFANIYTNGRQSVSEDIAKVFCAARGKYDHSTRVNNKVFVSENRIEAFNTEMERLFDIFCEDEKSRKHQEKTTGIKMRKEEYDFLYDMRDERKMYCENFFDQTWKEYYEKTLSKEKYLCGHQNSFESSAEDKEQFELSCKEEVLMEVTGEVTFASVDCDYQSEETQQVSYASMSNKEKRKFWLKARTTLD